MKRILFSLFMVFVFFDQRIPSAQKRPGSKEFAVSLETPKRNLVAYEGETVEIPLRIQNRGRESWLRTGKNPVFLSYHLLDENKRVIRFDNPRYPFPEKVKPGMTVEILAKVKAPLEKGKYLLDFDLVQEGIAWFRDYGAQGLLISLEVKKKLWPEDAFELTLNYGKFTKIESSVPDINKIFKLIRLTLAANEVKIKGQTGESRGFSAGKEYPQVWLRDANTIIPAARYFYDLSYLSSWLEEHLSLQDGNGSLWDWYDSRGNKDKNTTETDQETSAVQASHQVFELTGPPWLEKKIKEERIIDRLEKALRYVLRNRFDEKYGLLKGAHTVDWGDVDMNLPDQRAIYADHTTHWTCDIYDQSMFHLACQKLSLMQQALGEKEKADFWRQQSELIRKNANRWLWQEAKGFYKVHIHLDSLKHDFDESEIFAMGGNAMAILSGLTSQEKTQRILDEALKRQKLYGLSTISGCLLPPYPPGIFKHPLVDEPYEYQNGGQWDWFGGRLVFALFESGASGRAREKLLEILRKNLHNSGFFEWENREGLPRGSDFYAGSAGSLSKAIFEGYFGVKASKNSLSLEPRLGTDSGRIHLYIPACDLFVAYDYDFNRQNNQVLFSFNSNFQGKGKLRVLVPWEKIEKKNVEVLLDGKKPWFDLERIHQDLFIVLETDFKNRRLEIHFLPME